MLRGEPDGRCRFAMERQMMMSVTVESVAPFVSEERKNAA